MKLFEDFEREMESKSGGKVFLRRKSVVSFVFKKLLEMLFEIISI